MAANIKDLKTFYAMLKDYQYPKNGSWKDARALKHMATAFIVTMGVLEVVLTIWGKVH